MSENNHVWSPPAGEGITDFEGRVAFVTGGARGIGLGIVKALLRRGATVAVADISAGALDLARQALAGFPGHAAFYQLDVADRLAYSDLALKVHQELGTVTLLFNNAGIIDSISPSRATYEMWDYAMGINLAGVFNGIQAFLPGMLAAQRRSHIVNTSSEAGLIHAGSGFLYHASKYAVVGMSESLRAELGHLGVGVSVLFPGPVATDIVENTRKLRPDSAPTHSARVTAILDTAHRVLNEQGASPDGVGELVIDAVETNAPYVATRNEIADHLRKRTEDLAAAMEHAEQFLAAVSTAPEPVV